MIDPIAYQNGHWKPRSEVGLHWDDVGILQGAIAVERLRTYGGRLLWVDRYLQRLSETVEYLHIRLPKESTGIDPLLEQLLKRNAGWLGTRGECAIVVMVTPGPVGGQPSLILHTMDLPWERIARLGEHGQALMVSDTQQVGSRSWPRHLKVRSRLQYYLADHAAHAVDARVDALLLDDDGSVTETSTGNLIAVIDGALVCPEPDQVLPGVTFGRILELASRAGLKVRHERLQPQQVKGATEVMLTGTTAGIWSVTSIDGTRIGEGVPGPVCRQLQRLWVAEVGLDPWQQAAIKLTATARGE